MGKYLAPGERVVYLSRRHYVVLLKPAVVWIFAVAAVAALTSWVSRSTGLHAIDVVGIWVIVALSAFFGIQVLRWYKERYVFTNQRVLSLQGIVATQVSGVSLARVTETNYSRSVLGRLCGYGELQLDSAGEQLGLASLRFLPRPDEVYRLVSSLLYPQRSPMAHPLDPSEEDTGELPRVGP